MNRRNFVFGVAVLGLVPQLARAHHGWSGFDEVPVYLRGTVKSANWANPHAELMIDVPSDLTLPADLQERALPAQTSTIDGEDILSRTELPAQQRREWKIELAPLMRVNAWGIEEPSQGDEVEVIGYERSGDTGYVRAEYLFIGGEAYALRSGPA